MSFRLPFRKLGAGPILRSDKILLRPPAIDDFKAWVDLRKTSRSFLQPWEPEWQDDEFTRTSFRYRLHVYNKMALEERSLALFIFEAGGKKLLGAINLNNIRKGISQSASLGYWIGEAHARHGYMTAAARLLLDHAFHDMNLHRVEAACLPTNTASIALLKKIEFEQEGYAKSYLKIAGLWHDHLLFARLKSYKSSSP